MAQYEKMAVATAQQDQVSFNWRYWGLHEDRYASTGFQKQLVLCALPSYSKAMKISRLPLLIFTVACLGWTSVPAADSAFELEPVASGLGVPWGMAFVDRQNLLVTIRSGSALLVNTSTGASQQLSGLPAIQAQNQGGLLDVKKSAENQLFYFTYSKPVGNGAATTLASAKLQGNQLVDWQDLLVTDSVSGSGQHFGSRIAFDGQGHVFFSIGDRGDRDSAQDRSNHQGSILRLHLDGSVPEDNPFVSQAGVLPEIWSYGHRNPQGLAFDQQQSILWSIEHGPRGGDEINRIEPGKNYGWPVVSQGKEYWGPFNVGDPENKPGMEDAIKIYIPSIAPGSLLVYRGEAFPEWQGNLMAGALKLQHINRVTLSSTGQATGEERLLEDLSQRIRALLQDHQGWIYFSTDNGEIYRLKPNG